MCKQQLQQFIISFLGMDLSQVEMLEVEPVYDRERQQVRYLNNNLGKKISLKCNCPTKKNTALTNQTKQ